MTDSKTTKWLQDSIPFLGDSEYTFLWVNAKGDFQPGLYHSGEFEVRFLTDEKYDWVIKLDYQFVFTEFELREFADSLKKTLEEDEPFSLPDPVVPYPLDVVPEIRLTVPARMAEEFPAFCRFPGPQPSFDYRQPGINYAGFVLTIEGFSCKREWLSLLLTRLNELLRDGSPKSG